MLQSNLMLMEMVVGEGGGRRRGKGEKRKER